MGHWYFKKDKVTAASTKILLVESHLLTLDVIPPPIPTPPNLDRHLLVISDRGIRS
jgi:hypothetical protein